MMCCQLQRDILNKMDLKHLRSSSASLPSLQNQEAQSGRSWRRQRLKENHGVKIPSTTKITDTKPLQNPPSSLKTTFAHEPHASFLVASD
ncbi:HVA22-like protein a [Zea mays]|uniref:HVA22-like protein a n=1 Tax=Zea mays TaxID=4577 RepID=A0A1D6NRT6_MAIZE|nr:HVA22-like protein a [Zea mays]